MLLLVGWGLVGLSSYLLIGFWCQRPSAVAAAKKAFVMNAIGDVGLALGIFVIFGPPAHGRLHRGLRAGAQAASASSSSTANWIALLLLVGAIAQVGAAPAAHLAARRHGGPDAGLRADPRGHHGDGRRLPDRAHVAALLARARRLRPSSRSSASPTLTMAGLIALVQTDIKRVLAYSTMSQIGYMFCGVGIGAYSAGMFHLVTHAFFKALLFLGAGVVIHALARRAGHAQDGRPERATCRTRPV